MSACPYCAGNCADADLAPLLTEHLQWLWLAVGKAADRRGDTALTEGKLTVTTPAHPQARSAAVGLLGGSVLRSGQRRTIDLAGLTTRIRTRGNALTPGAVAAHALGRRLAVEAAAKRTRDELLHALHDDLDSRLKQLPEHVRKRIEIPEAWSRLRTAGWLARLAAHPHPHQLIANAAAVLAALPAPGKRSDRRLLVPTDPHALDDGTPLAGLVLALTNTASPKRRDAWDALGIDYDDLTGGLLALGIHPTGWSLPADAAVTIPPRELARCTWPPPPTTDSWVFVTENPSVVTAATELAANALPAAVRLLCTVGTPSTLEITAIAALADLGWKVAARADFDPAGLAHVRALLAASPAIVPWRMSATDYLKSTTTVGTKTSVDITQTDTPWDVTLASTMTRTGARGYEEALLPELLTDLATSRPPLY